MSIFRLLVLMSRPKKNAKKNLFYFYFLNTRKEINRRPSLRALLFASDGHVDDQREWNPAGDFAFRFECL